MQLTKQVYLGSPLAAASAQVDHQNHPDETNLAFTQWFHDTGWLKKVSAPAPEVREVLSRVPRTPAGNAWAEAAGGALTMAEADLWRPWDTARYDTSPERNAIEALLALAERVRTASPLLSVVADEIAAQALPEPFDLGDLAQARSRITSAGVLVGRRCFEHDRHPADADEVTWCESCETATVVPWAHIEFLAPSVHEQTMALLAVLDADLPEVAEADLDPRREDVAH